MGKKTDISWTDHTWNPWQGCKKVSQGCQNCYMFRDKKRFGQDPENIHRSSDTTFFSPFLWTEAAKVFTCSWSDFFLPEADLWRDDAWMIMRSTPHLTYQILTKRPENIKDMLPRDWPLPNVWIGVTAENQEQADIRIPILLKTKAINRFVSIEPMLEPIDIEKFLNSDFTNHCVNWVICGGESGPGARPIEETWISALQYHCQISGVPFFMKQMAGTNPKKIPIPDHLNTKEFPACHGI